MYININPLGFIQSSDRPQPKADTTATSTPTTKCQSPCPEKAA